MKKVLLSVMLLLIYSHRATGAIALPVQQDSDLLKQLMQALQSKGSSVFVVYNNLQSGLQGGSVSSTAPQPTTPVSASAPLINQPPTPITSIAQKPPSLVLPADALSFSLPVSSTKIGIGASCIAAFAAWLKMKLLANSVFRRGGWASWHSDIPCEVLMQLSDEEIVAELWPSICDHYSVEGEQVDAFKITQCFLNDIEKERADFQQLLWWHAMMRKIGLGGLLEDALLESKAHQRCQRLDLLQDCMHMWVNTCLCKGGIVNERGTMQ